MIKVPNLIGMTRADAEQALTDQGLIASVTEEYSTTEAGKVINQKTDSGDEVAKGSTVEFVVSKGEEPAKKVKIPAGLKGKSYSSVKATLANLGLVANPRYEENSEYDDGYVIFVEGEGIEVEEGSYVTVVVSTGSAPTSDSDNESQSSDSTN